MADPLGAVKLFTVPAIDEVPAEEEKQTIELPKDGQSTYEVSAGDKVKWIAVGALATTIVLYGSMAIFGQLPPMSGGSGNGSGGPR